MGPNNTPEQPPQKNAQEQARIAAEQIIADMRASYQSEVARINQIQDENQRIRERALLDQRKVEEYKSKLSEQVREATDTSQSDRPEDKQEKGKNAKKTFLEAKALGDEGAKVGDMKSQLMIDKIVENIKSGEITDQGALAIEQYLGEHLINGMVFSKSSDQISSLEKDLKDLIQVDQQAAIPIIQTLLTNKETYGIEENSFRQKLGLPTLESQNAPSAENNMTPDQQQQLMESMGQSRDKRFGGDAGYYETRFTDAQKEVLATFYDPEKFVTYMERLSNGDEHGDGKIFLKPDVIQREKEKITENIKKYYEKNNKNFGPGENLETIVDKIWGEEVSKKMEWNISDVINQLFLELQQKSPNKFYEQIMQEDIFQGPGMIQKRIQAAINSLMTEVEQIEKGDSDLAKRMKNLHLYQEDAKDSYIEERGEGKDDPNKKIYPRIHPLTHGERIGTTDFIRHIYQTIDQTISKAEYFHNSRAIYGHPPGEKGFYQQLGDFAEQMKGGGIDEILLLPDGHHIMEAYQLYEKMLQEDFAQMDHRHRPDQLSNKLERVNTQIELQVFQQLKEYYPELTDERLRNIVNSGVGISRGIFLTESEASAYADPIDSEGKGMVASYSTNDAGSLNVFNPMHTILRWQGEHNMNLMYFMPVNGESGAWDHHKAMKNAARYMDSLLVGKGRGVTGKGGLPEETFADAMMDIGNVGGPGKRKGWRMKGALEGHFSYDPDGTIDAPETFRAMEAIGYEAIYNFYINKQAGPDLLMATEKTDSANVKERRELFSYIYSRYFHEGGEGSFQESEFDDYWSKLLVKGKEKALNQIKKNGGLSAGDNWKIKSFEEEIAFETSQLFMENMLARYVAERMPTKFLRMDKNRIHDDGLSHWTKIWREFEAKGWKREDFDKTMKNLNMAEMLLGRQKSEMIRENIRLDDKWKLNQIDKITDLPYRLDENKIRELLSKNKEGGVFKSEKDISDAIEVYQKIKESYKKDNFIDKEGFKRISNYTFTFGLEDTDISLMTFRGTGPRMVARAIKDVASAEQTITPWIFNMPMVLNEIAINGKHDFSPIIEYMRKAQKAITDINGVPDTYEHMYKMAGTIINYFKKDAMAKPLFGLFRLGQRNSMAAEYSGRSSAVWEWDSRDIDRFAVALESYGLLKNKPYDLQPFTKGKIGGQLEDRWIKIPGIKKPIKFNLFGKKRHVDYEYNSLKLRKEHGADLKAITLDMVNQFLPIAIAFLLWKYIKDAMDEASGKKKQ
jgi:hypothetical protein